MVKFGSQLFEGIYTNDIKINNRIADIGNELYDIRNKKGSKVTNEAEDIFIINDRFSALAAKFISSSISSYMFDYTKTSSYDEPQLELKVSLIVINNYYTKEDEYINIILRKLRRIYLEEADLSTNDRNDARDLIKDLEEVFIDMKEEDDEGRVYMVETGLMLAIAP